VAPGGPAAERGELKAAVTGDGVPGGIKHGRRFEFKPVAGHLIAANQLPAVEPGTAVLRRLLIVPVERVIKGTPDDDPDAVSKLLPELPLIAMWCLQQASLVVGNRIEAPPGAADAFEDLAEAGDSVAAWLADDGSVVIDPAARASPANVHGWYRAWCKSTGTTPIGLSQFSMRLSAMGVRRTRTGQGRWLGMRQEDWVRIE